MNSLGRMAAIAILFLTWSSYGASARIVKVLPHFLDQKERISIHPSLFERDGYQAHLKSHPELCSGMEFDVQWKGRKIREGRLKVEVRGAKTPPRQVEVFQSELGHGRIFSRWSAVKVVGEDFKRIGLIIAWRITLWDGDQQVAEERSFLW